MSGAEIHNEKNLQRCQASDIIEFPNRYHDLVTDGQVIFCHFLAEFEIPNNKCRRLGIPGRRDNFQNPIFKFSNEITESYGFFIGHWDLVFEFYL